MSIACFSNFGMPMDVLRSIALMWRKHKANEADWGNYGYRLYRFTAKNGNEFWGINVWKINSNGIYKSTDIASVKKMRLDKDGLYIMLYDRQGVKIFSEDYYVR